MVPAARRAGVAAPALAAATRLIPTATPAAIPAPATVPRRQPSKPPHAVAVAAPVAAVAGAGAPPPATVAGGANGSGATVAPDGRRPRNAGVDGQPGIQRRAAPPGSPPGRRPAGGPPGRVRPTAVAVAHAARSRDRAGRARRHRRRGRAADRHRQLGQLQLELELELDPRQQRAARPSSAGARRSIRPTVTVSVLNGTATNGLAHRLASAARRGRLQAGDARQRAAADPHDDDGRLPPRLQAGRRGGGDDAEARSVGGSARRPEHAVRRVLGPEPLHHERRRYRRRESGEHPLRPEEA